MSSGSATLLLLSLGCEVCQAHAFASVLMAEYLSHFFRVRLSIAIQPAIYRSAQGHGLESAPYSVLFKRFWTPGSEYPKECFLSAIWHFWGSNKKRQKHSKSTFWGTPSQVPKTTQKATFKSRGKEGEGSGPQKENRLGETLF